MEYISKLSEATCDEEVIEFLVNTYGSNVKRLAYTYLKDWSLAEDITQEVFITSFKKLHTCRSNENYRSWIYKITINKCKDQLRRKSFFIPNIVNRLKDVIPIFESSAEENFIKQEYFHKLSSLVLDLPLKYREVIILFYYENFSIHEISKIGDINQGTVRTRLKRARQQLKEKLGGELNE